MSAASPRFNPVSRPTLRQRVIAFFTTRETRQPYLLACISLWSICFYLIITNFIGGAVEVQGESMAPTLVNGQSYVLNRWIFHLRAPRRGELVVLRDPGYADMAIKRVVALAHEQIEFRDGVVLVNGAKLPEPYLAKGAFTQPASANSKTFTVPHNHFFVLGDNRTNSLDSRFYGPLHRQQIVGLVTP